MTTSQTLTIDRGATGERTATVDGVLVFLRAKQYGTGYVAQAPKTARGTLRCQAHGSFNIGQCEHTGKPETVARCKNGRWHVDTDGWYAVPEQRGAVVLHFCGTHSPTKRADADAAQSEQHHFDFLHDEWLRRLKAVTTERNARVEAAEAKVLDIAREGEPGSAWSAALAAAATFLRAEIVAADTSAVAKRAKIEAEEPTR